MYLVCVQVEFCCTLQVFVLRRPNCAILLHITSLCITLTKMCHFVCGITNLIFALHINNILESYSYFLQFYGSILLYAEKEKKRILWCRT
jgi:hypothetical protein